MAENKIKLRSEIPVEDTWATEDLLNLSLHQV